MADRIGLMLRSRPDVKPLDSDTAERIAQVARAETVELADGGAVFGFHTSARETSTVRGNVEPAARFELSAHWHTRYELVDRHRQSGAAPRRSVSSARRVSAGPSRCCA
jgi:hypothetical protein